MPKTKREGVFETNSSSTHAVSVSPRKISREDYFKLGGCIRRGKIRFNFDRADWHYGPDTFYDKLQYLTLLRIASKFGCWDPDLRPGDVENDPDLKMWEEQVCSMLEDEGVHVDGFDYSECYEWDDEDPETDPEDKPEVTKDTPYTKKAHMVFEIDHQVVEDGPDTVGTHAIEPRLRQPGSWDYDESKKDEPRLCICKNAEKLSDIDILFSPNIDIWYGWDSYPWADDYETNPCHVKAELPDGEDSKD